MDHWEEMIKWMKCARALRKHVAKLEKQITTMQPIVNAVLDIPDGHLPTSDLYAAVLDYRAERRKGE